MNAPNRTLGGDRHCATPHAGFAATRNRTAATVIARPLLRTYYPVHIEGPYSLNRVNNDQALDKTRESRSKSPCRGPTTTLVARRGNFSKSCAVVR
jgi:hypothetical protein